MPDGTRVVEPRDGVTVETVIDTHEVVFGDGVDDVRDRQRVSLAGLSPDSDVPVVNTAPPLGSFGLVTRPVHPQGRPIFDETFGLEPGAVRDVVTHLVAEADMRVFGFAATGTGDGSFRLLANGVVLTSGKIDNLNRSIERVLPTSVPVPQGAALTLNVRCEGTRACDYEATIYTEVHDG